MKKVFILLFFCFSLTSQAQQPFVTTWEVTAGSLDIAIPINYVDYSYNYTVDLGDGTVLVNQTDGIIHQYSQPGIYTVSISGTFPHMDFVGFGDLPPYLYWAHKLKTVEQWGDIQWLDMSFMFYECVNLQINATDIPDTSQVTDMREMFWGASNMNADLSNWDVSNVSNFGGMFFNATSFDQDLSSWNFNSTNLWWFIGNTATSKINYDLLLGRLMQLNINNGSLGADGVLYCDAFSRQQLINNGWNINDGGIASMCNTNFVSGTVLFDLSLNGCDSNDIPFSNFLMNVNDGTNDFSYPLNENGQYNIMLDSGNYTLNIIDTSNNFNSNPSTQNVNFTSQNQTLDNIDFCMTANSVVEDLSIDIFPLGDAIPGFETNYLIHIENNGTEVVQNVQATLTFDDNFQSFMSSTFPPSSQTSNTLSFNLGSLNPFASESIEITLINAIPPTLNGGEILSFTTQVTPDANDSNPTDNTAIYNQVVVNSFDPNDKMVVQGDEIADENIGEYLDYRIRFQNVGTANALNVRIIDSISNNLDWTTFQPISASHDYRIEVKNQEQITYYFDNINLPYEDADAEGSNGYITYKIKPKSSVQIGDTFENTAYIYFDFNLPIVTNTVVTTVVDELSTIAFNLDAINLYPNPVKDILHLDIPPTFEFNSLSLFDLKGRLVKKISFQNQIDLEELSSGVYILQLDTNKGIFNEKIIKK